MIKLEIIEDTVRFYSEDVTRRAVDEDGVCRFITQDGRMCGVGRWLEDPFEYIGSAYRIMHISGKSVILENILKDKVKGHSVDFWVEIQLLHDVDIYWDNVGLTVYGIAYVNRLKQMYSII